MLRATADQNISGLRRGMWNGRFHHTTPLHTVGHLTNVPQTGCSRSLVKTDVVVRILGEGGKGGVCSGFHFVPWPILYNGSLRIFRQPETG